MKSLILASALLLVTLCTQAQSNGNNLPNERQIIEDIRARYKIINETQGFKVKEYNLEGYSAEGTIITTYHSGAKLMKAIAAYYGESGKEILEYYFWDDSIMFIFSQLHTYNSPIYVTYSDPESGLQPFDASKTKISENRYYFYQNKLIRWVDPEKVMINTFLPQFEEKEREMLDDVHQLIHEKLTRNN